MPDRGWHGPRLKFEPVPAESVVLGAKHVDGTPFVDYYELLQVSPNADNDTINRVFRLLAKKHHPDGGQGDPKRFNLLVEAYRTLANPETRAAYDVRYERYWDQTWKVATEASGRQAFVDDAEVRERLLSLFYSQRRRSMRSPGMSEMQLARLVGIPHEHMEFHLWYLKEKGWIQRLETGHLAITAEGVDDVERRRVRLHPERLIEARPPRTEADGESEEQAAGTSPPGR